MKSKTIIQGHEIAGRMPQFTKENRKKSVDGLKTQTRRVIKNPEQWMIEDIGDGTFFAEDKYGDSFNIMELRPYRVGDIRVMCEPLTIGIGDVAYYKDDGFPVVTTNYMIPWRWKRDTLNARYMPHEAARYLFEITEVRAERLQDISEEDAISEGIQVDECGHAIRHNDDINWGGTITAFAELWDSIYGKTHPWSENKMVWVYTYKQV